MVGVGMTGTVTTPRGGTVEVCRGIKLPWACIGVVKGLVYDDDDDGYSVLCWGCGCGCDNGTGTGIGGNPI